MRQSIRLQAMNQNDLFAQIIRILKQQFGTLPTAGIIAGQAVASAVYSVLNITHTAPYNDLDVFGTKEELPQGIFEKERYKASVSRSNADQSVGLYEGSFSYNVGVINVGSYSIEDSTVDPVNFRINYVKINAHGQSSTTGFGRHVLNGFDINCVQVGIDIKNGEVFWTPAFLDFLDSRQLAVTFYGTPMHSAVRLLKKNDDLPWAKLDIPGQMKKLQTVRQLIRLVEDERTTEHHTMVFPGNLFSEIYRARAASYEHVLSEYFSMEHRVLNLYRSEMEVTEDVVFYLLQPIGYDSKTLTAFLNVISTTGLSIGDASQFQSIEFLIRMYTKFEERVHADNLELLSEILCRFSPEDPNAGGNSTMLFMHINETLFDSAWEEDARQLSKGDFDSIAHMATKFTRIFEQSRARGLAFTAKVANAVREVSSMNARYLVRMLDGYFEELKKPENIDITNIDNWVHPVFLKLINQHIEQERKSMTVTSVPYPSGLGSLSAVTPDSIAFRQYKNLAELHDSLDPQHWSASIMMDCKGTYLPLEFVYTDQRGEIKGVMIFRQYTVKGESGDPEHRWQIADALYDKEQPAIEDSAKFSGWLFEYPGSSILKHLKDSGIHFSEAHQKIAA